MVEEGSFALSRFRHDGVWPSEGGVWERSYFVMMGGKGRRTRVCGDVPVPS